MVYCTGKLIENLNLEFIKAIDHTSYGFAGVITDVGRTLEKLVNYSPSFSQHPGKVITT